MGTLIRSRAVEDINGTRGIHVTLDGIYRPVSTHIIERLQQRCDECGVFRSLDDIESGDRVKIERGPFAEFICSVEDIQDDQRVGFSSISFSSK